MAFTLPITIPSTPSAGHSPASDDASNPPRTPVSPNMHTLALPDLSNSSNGSNPTQSGAPNSQMKRKPSRRANTAERRATHNAVERQRRETLNGRFLDLAALLPNLSQIRRPSKSSIVNSSIAHIHASRRHRLLASRELRLVKMESDALRRELNEWRDRAGLPRVEEPVRGEGFTMVLSGELEVIAAIPGEDEDEDGVQGGYNVYDDGDDDFGVVDNSPMDDSRNAMAQSMLKNVNANPFAHNLPSTNNLTHILPQTPQGPMIANSPNPVSFENPAMASMYEPHTHQGSHFTGAHYGHQHPAHVDHDKWNAQLYSALSNGGSQLQRSLFTPPTTGHGLPSPPPSSTGSAPHQYSDPASQALFENFHRQQQLVAMQQQQQQQQMNSHVGHIYGSPDREDSLSVGSSRGGRERSSSLSNSGYGSPQHPGSYDIPSVLTTGPGIGAGDYGASRRMAPGLHAASWVREADMSGMGMMKQNLSPPISVGSGGNGTGFAIMM